MQIDINALLPKKTYTYADYFKWDVKERLEIIKGKIFKMSPAPNLEHQNISMTMSGTFFHYLKGQTCKVFAAPFDVRLLDVSKSTKDEDIYTVVQPDICVVCDASKLGKRGCLGAPDLIIEILSPGTARKDLNEKYDIYEENGVREYWVVFPYEQVIQVFDLNEQGKYQMRKSYGRTESISSTVFSDFYLDLSEVFEERED